jgi:hypothetical protein
MVREKKAGDLILVNLFEDTKIERRKGQWEFFRHPRMDVTAMVPGLRIEAEGVGNPKGELNARRISFKPDVFAIEVAAEQQITANQEAAFLPCALWDPAQSFIHQNAMLSSSCRPT